MKNVLSLFLVFSLSWVFYTPLGAQSLLDRVSITERADGRGFVLRNHLSALPDSFRVVQPDAQTVQFVLYGIEKSAAGVQFHSLESYIPELFQAVRAFEGERFYGLELIFSPGHTFRASAYPDVNRRDLLIGLERTTQEGLSDLIRPEERIETDAAVEGVEHTAGVEHPEQADPPAPVIAQERRSFSIDATFGIRGGITSSNMYGAGYRREARSGTTMGMTADLAFQVRLPYDLRAGIETGISFAEKGFENPVADKFIVRSIEIDYIEIPILAKAGYGGLGIVTPHVVAGPYIGFMASAERVREDGSRADMDDQVRNLDFGWITGAGLDVRIGGVIASLQVRHSFAQTPIFTDPLLDDGEKNRQLAFVFGFRF